MPNRDDDAPLVPPPGCPDDHPQPRDRYVDDRGPYRRVDGAARVRGDIEIRRIRRR